jgi:hypothetical protein
MVCVCTCVCVRARARGVCVVGNFGVKAQNIIHHPLSEFTKHFLGVSLGGVVCASSLNTAITW